MYLGRAKETRKNRDKRIRTRPAPWGGSCEGGKVSTLYEAPSRTETAGSGGEAQEPRRRAQPQGRRGQSGEIPAQRVGADQHSPDPKACLLTRQGGRGLGAEARVSVGSQGEDWGWQRKHSLKGASAAQLARRESGKKFGPA